MLMRQGGLLYGVGWGWARDVLMGCGLLAGDASSWGRCVL